MNVWKSWQDSASNILKANVKIYLFLYRVDLQKSVLHNLCNTCTLTKKLQRHTLWISDLILESTLFYDGLLVSVKSTTLSLNLNFKLNLKPNFNLSMNLSLNLNLNLKLNLSLELNLKIKLKLNLYLNRIWIWI